MSWYVIDAVDRAVERTRKCLIEPFDLWKWIKLSIIALFLGGGGGGNFNGSGNSYGGSEPDMSQIPAGLNEVMDSIYNFISSYSLMSIIIGVILALVLFALVMRIVGSIMEFVFVGSLVSNDVQIRKYFKMYFGKGISLFVLRFLLGLVVLLVFILLGLASLSMAGISISDLSDPSSIDDGKLLMLFASAMIFGIFILLVVSVIMGIIESFINLAIPVSMYSECSIFSGLSRVLAQFRNEWKQVVIYWLGRAVLIIAVGIAVAILGLIIGVIIVILMGLADLALYYILSSLVADTTVWMVLIPVIVIEFFLLIFAMVFVGMPAKVFMKYHMLTFLQMWYPIDLPVFDKPSGMYGMVSESTEDW